jgi:GNAT superfamily N-acetyltransferase
VTAATRTWVRPADPADAPAIREVAALAWRATYAGRLADETIERYLAAAYSEDRIAVRIARHEVLVAALVGGDHAASGAAPAASAPDGLDAFAEVTVHDDHLQLVAIYARPTARGRGLGTALVAAIVEAHPGEDLAADVLLDNELAEPFYAARGFLPGEFLIDEIAGDPVRERRWWLRAAR